MHRLRPFQERFLSQALGPGIDTAALSVPRGNGKSWLAGRIVASILVKASEGGGLAGTESVLCAASLDQAAIVFRFARQLLEPRGGYRFQHAGNRLGITHVETNSRLRVLSSSGKQAMGLVGCPIAICDEPGAWEAKGGELMNDAIQTAQGKPGSPLRAVYIGTLAPSRRGWWHDMVKAGSHGSTYVQHLQGRVDRWDKWPEIRRCNPLCNGHPEMRKKLIEERNEARRDTRLKARFLSYRLNLPTADESEVLLTAEDWQRVRSRGLQPPLGQPIVGVDLGHSRAWSAAVAIWPNGRVEAIAVAPGLPDIEAQERRDLVPRGAYTKLVRMGVLAVADGLNVPPVSLLADWIREKWGGPAAIICDHFRLPELRDSGFTCQIISRRTQWSEASFDIRSLQKMARDGPMSSPSEAEALILESLVHAVVQPDLAGNVRLIKSGSNNVGRDDVAAALVLAAGAAARRPAVVDAPMFRVV